MENVIDSVEQEKTSGVNADVPTSKRQIMGPETSDIIMDDGVDLVRRFSNTQICPHFMDKLECFDSIMAVYLDLLGDKQGKRTYIGKRNLKNDNIDVTAGGKLHLRLTDILLGKVSVNDRARQWVQNEETRNGFTREDKIRQMCSSNKNKDLCNRLGLVNAIGTLFRSSNMQAKGSSAPSVETSLRKRGLCDGVPDTVSCFDHYLGMYANMHPSSSGANQFVGKR